MLCGAAVEVIATGVLASALRLIAGQGLLSERIYQCISQTGWNCYAYAKAQTTGGTAPHKVYIDAVLTSYSTVSEILLSVG